MDKVEEINVGDVVTISRGTRYPPKVEESIGIVIEECWSVGGPIFMVMWNGHVDELPARRLKKIDKTKHACIKQPKT
tara:strand:+ start:451 stop:681 length:231 start_codon:yes stop_codon:yes gene_type:complete